MMKLLITGFEPFGGQKINPSWQAVQRIEAPKGVSLIRAELPVCWGKTSGELGRLLRLHRPNAVLLTGQAGGADRIRIERVGINLRDSTAPDNAGHIHRDEPIFPDAPAAYFTTYDHHAILAALKDANLPAGLSFSAGAYLCNEALYTALHLLPDARAGFIHLPYLPEQTETAFSLPLEKQVLALQLAVNTFEHLNDIGQ